MIHNHSDQCSPACKSGRLFLPFAAPTVHACAEYESLPIISPCAKCDNLKLKANGKREASELSLAGKMSGHRAIFPHAGGMVTVCTTCRNDIQNQGDKCRSGQKMSWNYMCAGYAGAGPEAIHVVAEDLKNPVTDVFPGMPVGAIRHVPGTKYVGISSSSHFACCGVVREYRLDAAYKVDPSSRVVTCDGCRQTALFFIAHASEASGPEAAARCCVLRLAAITPTNGPHPLRLVCTNHLFTRNNKPKLEASMPPTQKARLCVAATAAGGSGGPPSGGAGGAGASAFCAADSMMFMGATLPGASGSAGYPVGTFSMTTDKGPIVRYPNGSMDFPDGTSVQLRDYLRSAFSRISTELYGEQAGTGNNSRATAPAPASAFFATHMMITTQPLVTEPSPLITTGSLSSLTTQSIWTDVECKTTLGVHHWQDSEPTDPRRDPKLKVEVRNTHIDTFIDQQPYATRKILIPKPKTTTRANSSASVFANSSAEMEGVGDGVDQDGELPSPRARYARDTLSPNDRDDKLSISVASEDEDFDIFAYLSASNSDSILSSSSDDRDIESDDSIDIAGCKRRRYNDDGDDSGDDAW